VTTNNVHMWHCHAGEEFGTCKYGGPALQVGSPQTIIANQLKAEWKAAVAADQTTNDYWNYATENGNKLWRAMYAAMSKEET